MFRRQNPTGGTGTESCRNLGKGKEHAIGCAMAEVEEACGEDNGSLSSRFASTSVLHRRHSLAYKALGRNLTDTGLRLKLFAAVW